MVEKGAKCRRRGSDNGETVTTNCHLLEKDKNENWKWAQWNLSPQKY